MSTAPKPKVDHSGRYLPNGSKAKAALNVAILSSAWGIMVLYTAYKALRQNKVVIKLSPQHTSQECHHCGYIHPGNRQSQAKFVCLSCGDAENADLNAAKVLQKRGVKTILSTLEWDLNSDQTLVAKSLTRGTRGRARGGKPKTSRPKALVQSLRSANLVVVAQST